MTAAEVAVMLDARPTSRGWIARCPAHDDRSPSLSIAEGHGGRVLMHDFAGCDTAAVCEAVGLKLTDLMPASARPMRSKPRTTPSAPVSRPPARKPAPAINTILTALSVAGIDWRISDRGSVSRAMTTMIDGVAVPSGPDCWMWTVERCPCCDQRDLWIWSPPGEPPRFACADGCTRDQILAALATAADLAGRGTA